MTGRFAQPVPPTYIVTDRATLRDVMTEALADLMDSEAHAYSVEEAAKRLGVSKPVLYAYIADGRCPSVAMTRTPNGVHPRRLITRRQLDEFVRRLEAGA